jgi:NB-ARC domain
MTIDPSDLQAVVDRLEAGADVSEQDLQILAIAVRSRQISIATGERAVAVGGSADGATIVTGNGNFFFDGVKAELILNLLREWSSPDSLKVAPLPRVRLPDNFVPRPDALNSVKAKLLREDDQTLVVSAIAGLGGIGKSVLAIAVVLDPEVQARFEDGILWVTLGQNPDLLSLLGDWIRELDKSREAFSANTLEAAARYLGTLLAERRMLLVVDDVWNAAHAEWFRAGGGGCRALVTTREARLEGAEYYDLDLMTEDEAIELVRQKLGRGWQPAKEAEVKAFANLLGRLPLALDLAANQVRDGLTWGELQSEFEAERRAVFQGTGRRSSALQLLDSSEAWERLGEEEQRKYSLQACFNLSLKRLKPQQFQQFTWLGVLPEDVNLDRRVAAVLWDLSPFRAQKVLIDLRNRSFLTGGVDTIEGEPSYRVHDLMHDLARISIDCPPSNESNQLGGLGMSIAAAHQGFLERYRTQAEDRRWDKLPSDGYIHRRLTWHMIQAGWLDEIHALMAMSDDRGNNAWFEACDRIGKLAIFIEDVARVWELAEQIYASEPTRSIVLQCRYALITATLNSLVAKLPIEMMREFVKKGFWTVEQAWAYVEQMQDENKVGEAIQALAPYLTKSLFAIALEKAQGIQEEDYRAWVLSRLAAIDGAYFSEALTAARGIENMYHQALVLSSLVAIDDAYFSEAFIAVHGIHDEYDRLEVLSRLAAIDGADFTELLTAARGIEEEDYRAKVLISLAAIDGADFTELLTAARGIQKEDYRAEVLISLAAIDGADFTELLTAAREIQAEYYWVEVLISLAAIDGAYFSEALTAARGIEEEYSRAKVLSSLAAIDGAYCSEALTAARGIEEEYSRAKVLSSLAAIDGAYCSEALTAARAVQYPSYRAEVLISLLSSLAAIDGAGFSEALTVSRGIQSEDFRLEVLSSLAAIDGADFIELLTAARGIDDEYYRVEVLISLAAIDGAYFSEALTAARGIEEEDYRAKVLISLAAIDGAYFSEALTAARGIQSERDRVKVLISLAAIDGADFTELLTAARGIQSEWNRAKVLSSLATIDGADFAELLTAARGIQKEDYRAEVLISLAASDGADFSEALTAARGIQSERDRAEVLSSLAASDGADFAELLAAACGIQKEDYRAKVLSSLAANTPPSFLCKIWEAISQITDKPTRTKAISGCLPNLPLDQLSHHDWCNYLHLLSHRKRFELMEDITKLYPAIIHLGGSTAMRGVVDAMNEVCSQWR